MAITYDQIKREVKALSEEVSNSTEEVSGVFSTMKVSLLPAAIYFSFFFLSAFSDYFLKDIWLVLGFFSIFFWLFFSIFLSGYKQMSSMLPKDAGERYEIVRIFQKKSKCYYFIWVALITLGGFLSLFTILNVMILSVITFVVSILLVVFFNIDVSRYQLASALGVLSAVEDKINRRGD